MKIRISKNTTDKLTAAIEAAEGRADTRCLSAGDLIDIAQEAEQRLSALHLRKSDMPGARVGYSMAISLPNAYRYRPQYTHASITRGSSGWFLTRVGRVYGSNKQPEKYGIVLTSQQGEIARERFSSQFAVMDPA